MADSSHSKDFAYDEAFSFASRKQNRQIDVHDLKRPSPVLLNWFGGGFTYPGHGSGAQYCRHVADSTSCVVLDANYALAPPHAFPAALEDVVDLVLLVIGQPERYDANSIVLSGFSSGGNLALAAAANPTFTKLKQSTIRAVVVFYPVTDMTVLPHKKPLLDGSLLDIPDHLVARMMTSREAYIPREVDPADPRISVLFAEPSDFPDHTLIITAEHDRLAAEAEKLAAKLETAGKAVVLRRFANVGHGFDKEEDMRPHEVEARDEAYQLVAEFLLKVQGHMQPVTPA